MRDAKLANTVSTTEIIIADFYKKGHLTLRLGQLLSDNLRHPRFDPKDLRSETIVHLLRRFERPFKETAIQTYNLWKERDENQCLEFFCARLLSTNLRCRGPAFDRAPRGVSLPRNLATEVGFSNGAAEHCFVLL